MKLCTFCGDDVSDQDYDFIGRGKVWICGKAECDREARDAEREAQEHAQYDAQRDGYERYM